MDSPFFCPDGQWDEQWQPTDPSSFDWQSYYDSQPDLGNPSTIIFPEDKQIPQSTASSEVPTIYLRKYTIKEFDDFKETYPEGFILIPVKSAGILRRKRIESIEMSLLLDDK